MSHQSKRRTVCFTGRCLHCSQAVLHRWITLALLFSITAIVRTPATAAVARTECADDFAPAAGLVDPLEKPLRHELCLNGRWQFQPVAVPAGYVREKGIAPELPLPDAGKWDAVLIKIPSPWNANDWGSGGDAGPGTGHPYWPSSRFFPSYPRSWEHAEMGWLRRSFRVPADWPVDQRLQLHFEAVAGDCQIIVNGHIVGTHFDKYLPFDIDITDWASRDRDNELLVGVRASALFDLQSTKYPKMRCPFPCGSNTDRLVGIWQDVSLQSLPAARIADVFVKPWLDRGDLELTVTLHNDTDQPRTMELAAEIRPWINLAGPQIESAPVPISKLAETVLTFSTAAAIVPAQGSVTVTIHQSAGSVLKPWQPGQPQLYSAVLTLSESKRPVDRSVTRFGWRQFTIDGSVLKLNGHPIRLTGDLLHPFGPFVLSRRYAWAWYRMIQDMGGNAVRLHAQPMPRFYLDLADEMGLVVLDETAIFGSAVSLNFEPDIAWSRFTDHYDGLIQRDRNHPAVMGWSMGNELFAIFNLNHVSTEDAGRWYGQLGALALRARTLDPTRPWVSCDGDEDLRGTLPVYSKHFGLGLPVNRLPTDVKKPLMVGESGGSYYARPAELAIFNGDKAFGSYSDRNDALGIDAYDNIVHMARPKLAYYSASETAWFGIKHLPLGYHDASRLPDDTDGVFFTQPFVEGKPGMQIERIPPFVTTFNPGWDRTLPLYAPLGMFKAEQAALSDPPQPCPWDHREQTTRIAAATAAAPAVDHVGFFGDLQGALARQLRAIGVPLSPMGQGPQTMEIAMIDAGSIKPEDASTVLQITSGKTPYKQVILFAEPAGPSIRLSSLLPLPAELTDRAATQLVKPVEDAATASLTARELYFAEQSTRQQQLILHHGLGGDLVTHSRVLLTAGNTDWSLFNNQPEVTKCGAEVLYEQLQKPDGAALLRYDLPGGMLLVSTIDTGNTSDAAVALWRTLFTNLGIKLGSASSSGAAALDEDFKVAHAMALGRFKADDVETALKTNDAAGLNPGVGNWKPISYADHDRFLISQFDPVGPAGAGSVYLSFWLYSPRALDELLNGGPDVPRVGAAAYVFEKCRLFLNDREILPARSEPADYRTLNFYESLPLSRGWNHIVVKLAASKFTGEHPPTLAMRFNCSSADFLKSLGSSIQPDLKKP